MKGLYHQGAKKVIFKACHSGKLKLEYTSSNIISTCPKNILMSRIDFTVLLLFKFLKKIHLPVRQVKVIPLFSIAHPLLRITLPHPRWQQFFLLAQKEQTRAALAEVKVLFSIIMPQIG